MLAAPSAASPPTAAAPALAEMMHSGVAVDEKTLKTWAADLKWFLRDCRAVAEEVLGIPNLDAHRKVNAACGVYAKKDSGACASPGGCHSRR